MNHIINHQVIYNSEDSSDNNQGLRVENSSRDMEEIPIKSDSPHNQLSTGPVVHNSTDSKSSSDSEDDGGNPNIGPTPMEMEQEINDMQDVPN